MWVVGFLQIRALSFPWLSGLFLIGKTPLTAYRRDRMKVLLSLGLFCLTLALCHAACFTIPPKLEFINGMLMLPYDCIDPYDGSKHSSESRWNSANCLECSCSGGEISCCTRYGGVASSPGCKAVVNRETCEFEFYRIDNPSEPCF